MRIQTKKEAHYGKKQLTLGAINLYINLIVLITVAVLKLLDNFIGFGLYINTFDIIAVITSIIGITIYFSKKTEGIQTIVTAISLLFGAFVCFKNVDPITSHFNIFMIIGIALFILAIIIFKFSNFKNDNSEDYTMNPKVGLIGAIVGIVISLGIIIFGGMLSDNYYGGTIKVEIAMMLMFFAIIYAAVATMEIKKLKR